LTDKPLVTVIGLCYNTGNYVRQSLDCLPRQTLQDVQLVIVDDGSTDGSDRVVADWIQRTGYPCTFLRNEKNAGIPAVFNRALPLARGEYVTWIADDLWEDDRLERVVTVFRSLPESVGIVFGDAVLIDGESRVTGAVSPRDTLRIIGHPEASTLEVASGETRTLDRGFVHEALFWRCFLPAPSVTVRRRIYDVIGPYDTSLFIEDLDCWFRASRHFDFGYARHPLVRYRVHGTNFSSGISHLYLDSLSKTLLRHRHEATLTRTRRALRRHLREEAYRVITRLSAAGLSRNAVRVFFRYYLPNLDSSSHALKDTAKAVGFLLRLRGLSPS
jgi:glycosyltransferase involved in cell wall biosynthesis